MTWRAAGYCHKPLYFEQWNFERYGHSVHPVADPFLSAGHFFTTAAFLPYKMGVELPWECMYPSWLLQARRLCTMDCSCTCNEFTRCGFRSCCTNWCVLHPSVPRPRVLALGVCLGFFHSC
jgi:hypothetical protein